MDADVLGRVGAVGGVLEQCGHLWGLVSVWDLGGSASPTSSRRSGSIRHLEQGRAAVGTPFREQEWLSHAPPLPGMPTPLISPVPSRTVGPPEEGLYFIYSDSPRFQHSPAQCDI